MLSLPSELIEATLLHTDALDIVRCQQVCRTLLELVKSSTRLQYKIECFVSRVQDGLNNTCSTQERLERLRGWRSMWHEGRLQVSRVIEREPTKNLVQGEIMDEMDEDRHGLLTITLARPHRGIPEKRQDMHGLGFVIADVWYNRPGTLLMAVEDIPEEVGIYVHLLCMNGRRHPDAALPILKMHAAVFRENMHCACMELHSRLLVTADALDDDYCHFWVWDWQKGVLLMHADSIPQISFRGVDFLNDRYLLIACQKDNLGRLLILDYTSATPLLTSYNDLVENSSFILELPRLKNGFLWTELSILSTPVNCSRDIQEGIFRPIGDAGFMWLEARIRNAARASPHIFVLPTQSILFRLAAQQRIHGCRRVHQWSEWAAEARYLPSPFIRGWGACLPYLSRFICTYPRPTTSSGTNGNVVVYYEFGSVHSMRRDLASNDTRRIASIHWDPSTPDPEVFDSAEETRLPYREVVTNIVVPYGYVVRLEEECVLVMSGDTSRVWFFS